MNNFTRTPAIFSRISSFNQIMPGLVLDLESAAMCCCLALRYWFIIQFSEHWSKVKTTLTISTPNWGWTFRVNWGILNQCPLFFAVIKIAWFSKSLRKNSSLFVHLQRTKLNEIGHSTPKFWQNDSRTILSLSLSHIHCQVWRWKLILFAANTLIDLKGWLPPESCCLFVLGTHHSSSKWCVLWVLSCTIWVPQMMCTLHTIIGHHFIHCTISYHFWPSVTLLHCALLGDQYHEHQVPLSLWAHQLLIGRHSVGFLPFFEFPSHKGRDENKKCWNGRTSRGINQGEGFQYLLSSADEEVQTKTCKHRRLRTSGTKWGLEWSHWSWNINNCAPGTVINKYQTLRAFL